jgi:DNA-binding transcriptional ArsR family regulator
VTSSAQDLLSFQTSLRPPRSLRILAAVAVGVVFTLATSPLSPVWILLVFAAAVILVSLWTAAQNRARGLRGNGHAPMRPDAETSVVLGGDIPLPRPWWRQWDLWLPLAYLVVCFAVSDTLGAIDSPVVSWIAAVALGCLATAGLLWWWVGNDGSPSGHLPLSTLVRQAPQWRPADDGEAVAAVLYAVDAYPRGRQLRRDTLDTAAEALFDLTPDAVSRALRELSGHGAVVVTVERDRDGVRTEWLSLTPAGVDAVTASFRSFHSPVG